MTEIDNVFDTAQVYYGDELRLKAQPDQMPYHLNRADGEKMAGSPNWEAALTTATACWGDGDIVTTLEEDGNTTLRVDGVVVGRIVFVGKRRKGSKK